MRGTSVRWVVVLVLSGTAALATSAPADWNQPSGGAIGTGDSTSDCCPSIALMGGAPEVAYSARESGHFQVRVKRLEGSAFAAVGDSPSLSPTENSGGAELTVVGGVLYVAWQENAAGVRLVHVKRFDGANWVTVGTDPLNLDPAHNASNPMIADVGGVPYVSWVEFDGTHSRVYVKRFDGTDWVAVGSGYLNNSAPGEARFPVIAAVGGVPYVAWMESSGANDQLFVKRFNGALSLWESVGAGALNISLSHDVGLESLASIGGVPYVAWTEDDGTSYQLHVMRFDGTSWSSPGNESLNVDPAGSPGGPNIADIGGVPVVMFQEADGASASQIRVKRLRGTDWVSVGGSLNADPSRPAYVIDPAMTDSGGVPYATWEEVGSRTDVIVKRLEPSFLSEEAAATDTTAVLTARIDDFGLPLPLGFELGTTEAYGTSAPPQLTPGTGVSSVSSTVSGLTPATSYVFRAFGADGTGQTSRGAAQPFATQPAPIGAPPPGKPLKVDHISGLKVAPSPFVAASSGPTVKAARSTGAVVSYKGTDVATTTFTVVRPVAGRRQGKRCVKPTTRNRSHGRCTRSVVAGSFKHADVGGANRFRFTGRLRGKRLRPGRYVMRAVPRNAAGVGTTATRAFRIKR
jgi:hypothetical protein